MTVDLTDVQGNVLRGFGPTFAHARHLAAGIGHGARAREFLAGLLDGNGDERLQVTTGATWDGDDKPASCLNVGITWRGLQALGVEGSVLDGFPKAFREGPATRAVTTAEEDDVGLGDVGNSHPDRWVMGGPRTPPVDLVVSVYAQDADRLKDVTSRLREALGAHRMTERHCQEAHALAHGRVHFGYRDGIAQPRIAGGLGNRQVDLQPEMPLGDLLLGRDYANSFGGNHAGDLPAALVDNATYGAFRILYQDAAAFERLIWRWGQATSMTPELIAAKLMGRWRNGVPLTMSPDTPQPDPPVPDIELDAFDYVAHPGYPGFTDDPDGVRCPVGAHIRRLNPRGALVMGKPHSRRIVRRNMPYGPELKPDAPDDGADRGIVGYFLCADLTSQWEFLQRVYVNGGIATHGIRNTREPIGGAQPEHGGTFRLPTGHGTPLELEELPTLVETRGSAYCLLPGIGGLRHLASLSDPEGPSA